MRDITAIGTIDADMLRQAFPGWNIAWHQRLGVWLALRGGLHEWTGPQSLIQRVLSAEDLPGLADRLSFQQYLDGLDPEELARVYRAWKAAMS